MDVSDVIFASSQITSAQAPSTTFTTTITYGWAFGLPIYSETVITSQIGPRTRPRVVSAATATDTACFDCSFASIESLSSQTSTAITSPSAPSLTFAQSTTRTTSVAGGLAGQNAAQSTSQNHSGGISGGAIAAAVIVPIIAVAILIAGILFFLRRRKQRRLNQVNTPYSANDGPAREMAMAGMVSTAGSNNRPLSNNPPTLNHIVPGVLAKESGASAVTRKPVPGTTRNPSTPRPNQSTLAPISTVNEHSSSRDPFATPTPGSTAQNTPEDGPNYLASAAEDSTPSRILPGPYRRDELFMGQTDTGGVGRQWHSVNGTSRFGGRDPRQSHIDDTRPTSPQDDFSDFGSEEGDVEIGQATVAVGKGQRASVIDMHQIGYNGSPPKDSPLSGERQ